MLALTTPNTHSGGIRRVNLVQDLRPIADLIELCFSDQMDSGGRATIQDMRMLSRMGPLLHLLALGDRMLRGIGQGFVWEDGGRIVGNVTLFPAPFPAELGRVFVVANVAVHPDYRRRGLARHLMESSMEAIRRGGGTAAILQVDGGNEPARQLYLRLGYRSERVWHNWYRSSRQPAPYPLPGGPPIVPRPGALWRAEYELAARLFPPERGGLGWQRPLHRREFTQSSLAYALGLLGGSSTERWIVAEGDSIRASLWARAKFGRATELTLLCPPEEHAALAGPLLNYGLRRLEASYRGVTLEYPADIAEAEALLRGYHFSIRRTLEHMRIDF
ncbi:MAG: GNAT family N-acetyltransferase [Anaerolineae bacterium]|nr:GNAT family N-acetyltransferase [Anaerolineae bacterium]